MSESDLFGVVTGDTKGAGGNVAPLRGEERMLTPNREQMLMLPMSLEAQVPRDHVVRAVWRVVVAFDLSSLVEAIRARGSHPGRPVIDPRILVSLWVYATIEGVGSAREIARLSEAHAMYRWICGGVHVSYHTLSDFRVDHPELVEKLLTSTVAALENGGVIKVSRVAQDGMRVRASAGASSFHRMKTLKKSLEDAKVLLEEVTQRAQDAEKRSGEQAAQVRAAAEQEKRLAQAVEELRKIQNLRPDKDPEELRASSTDPEARVMKMADGGFRPAYNVHFATTTEGRGIVGVIVTNAGNDNGQMPPMTEEVAKRVEGKPVEWLVDGGFAKKEDIETLAEKSITVYAPLQKPHKQGVDPHEPKQGDTPAVVAWRLRMSTEVAKQIYRERGSVAELVNADTRCHRGLNYIPVRGLTKARTVALWMAIAYNITRWVANEKNEANRDER